MNALINLLAQIPATFWAVILGSLGPLAALFLTNHYHNRRLQAQFAHDRDLKNREREMSLRKDIYLGAAEAVSAGLIAVSRFANLEIPHEKLTEGYLDKAPSIAKVHVIGKEATVRAVVNFSAELNATFLRLGARRYALVSQKQQIESLRSESKASRNENDRTLELMKQYNIDGLNDPRKWDVLQKNFDFEQRRGEEARQKADTLAATLYPMLLQYTQECVGESIRLGGFWMPALFSARKELELPLDETEYHRIADEVNAKQVDSLNEFIQQVQSQIAAQRAAAGAAPPAPDS